jgi:Holliday junction resolvase
MSIDLLSAAEAAEHTPPRIEPANTVTFTVPGPPQGKGRARSAARIIPGKGGAPMAITRHYTPAKTAAYENLVRLAAQEAMSGRAPFLGPIRVEIVATCPIPTSWSGVRQRRAADGSIAPTTKPDPDNIEKAICDGLTGVAYRDDVQIVEAVKRKRYGSVPGVTVRVVELALERAQGKAV